MRTIRANCFETNSSSTHSVTIQSKSKSRSNAAQLVTDGVLQPQNLRDTHAYRESARDGYTIHAGTKDQKAALFVHHLKSVSEYGEWDADLVSRLFDYAIEQLIVQVGYAGINTSFNYGFGYADEEGGTYIDEIFESDVPEAAIHEHVRSVILNDDIEIIDSEDAY